MWSGGPETGSTRMGNSLLMAHAPLPTRTGEWGAIVVCGMPFDGDPPFADTHLARALSQRRPVLAVDRPSRLGRGGDRGVDQVGPNLWRIAPRCLPRADSAGWSLLSDPLVAREIARAARRVLPPQRALITLAPSRGTLFGLRRDVTVYWRRDAAADHHYVTSVRHVAVRHRRLLERADLVTAVSPDLVADSARIQGETHLVPNGADTARFAIPAGPDPLADVTGPVIGYLGALSWRIDVELLEQLSAAHPEWTFVLIGKPQIALPDRPNLRIIGPRPYADLPRWAQRFDVGLVPYRNEEFNRASFPLKVFDYLAAGAPVVAPPLPALAGMEPFVRTADGAAAFGAAIGAALLDAPSRVACQAVAEANSWGQRAEDLDRLVTEYLTRNSLPTAPER